MILTRMVGMLGPIDLDMLVNGQETFKYFTKEYDLYYLNEVSVLSTKSNQYCTKTYNEPKIYCVFRKLIKSNI